MGPVVESPYGAEVEPNKAPEAISNAVASLPPEQMYELMRQMKLCVRNNPQEARTMLMNNPQLAYALLQAQVCVCVCVCVWGRMIVCVYVCVCVGG